nr:proline-rich receptor-like protein kinase PERK9 isoform X1 [Aegilops tauschii subsp. strangulata]
MSSPPPNPSLPLPGSSVAPAPAVLTPEEVSGALRDLTQAVQEIRLFLAGSYRPHPAAPPIAATAPPWLPWQPLHQAASAALPGPLQLPSTAPPWLQWQPPLLAASAVPGAPPQQPLPLPQGVPAALAGPPQLPSTATTAPPWLQWQPPLLAASATPGAPLQQPPPVSSGPASTAPVGVSIHQIKFPPSPLPLPQGVPIQQIKFPPSPSPLPAWITTRHMSAAVRLQAAARGLLARRRVREMRGLQLLLLPALRKGP